MREINDDFSLEWYMFATGLTKGIYDSFLRELQLKRSEIEHTPFIYVDTETGTMRYLTNLMSTGEAESEILAVSVGTKGLVEVLSTEAH